jgi:hypothetical protein
VEGGGGGGGDMQLRGNSCCVVLIVSIIPRYHNVIMWSTVCHSTEFVVLCQCTCTCLVFLRLAQKQLLGPCMDSIRW